MNNPNQAPARYPTTLLIWAALGAGQLLFLAIVCFMGRGKFTMDYEGAEVLLLIAAILTSTNLMMGNILFKLMEKNGHSAQAVQTRNIVRWALFEGAALFSIVVLMMTHSLYVVPLIAVLLAAHGKTKPTPADFNHPVSTT